MDANSFKIERIYALATTITAVAILVFFCFLVFKSPGPTWQKTCFGGRIAKNMGSTVTRFADGSVKEEPTIVCVSEAM